MWELETLMAVVIARIRPSEEPADAASLVEFFGAHPSHFVIERE